MICTRFLRQVLESNRIVSLILPTDFKTFTGSATLRLALCIKKRSMNTKSSKNPLKLITDAGNPAALKIIASSLFFEVPIDIQVSQKKETKSCIYNQLPVLECGDNHYLFNANSASCYLYNISKVKHEISTENKEKQDEILEWESFKLQAAVQPYLSTLFSGKKDSNTIIMESVFQSINSYLGQKPYLLGSFITASDIVVWASLYAVMQEKDIQDISFKLPAVNNWFNKLSISDNTLKAVDVITQSKGISAFKAFFENYVLPSHLSKNIKHIKDAAEELQQTEEIEGPSDADIKNAKSFWLKGRDLVAKPRKLTHPILPKEGEKNILITSALPYVNNVPHLGNIIGCTLSADVYARYCRLRNLNVLYICGTDEYGTATETKAFAEGLTPQQICDKYNKIHSEIYTWFNIEFDCFGRTTTEHQTKITQDIFWKIEKNGYLCKDAVDQLKCEQCERFLADRFVEGICPFCSYEDARGDQCDACGKLINATELKKPRCKQCGSSPVIKSSNHIFLDLPKIEPMLKDWIMKSEKANWTVNAKNITRGWIAEGLKPRCITRDLKWGTPVPMEGYTDKVFYVWFDAPIGYISITANYTDQWEKWWKNPEQVTLVQFMAKDNVPFHTVVFPSSLLAAKDNYTILNEISATEYLNYENDKFSKSRGVGVFGDHAESTGIPADMFRFYLLYIRPESQDSFFQWDDFITKNNSELLNNLGNFVNRALMFLKNNFNSTLPNLQLQCEDYNLVAGINRDLHQYIEHLDAIKLKDGLRCILNMSRLGNQYMQAHKPWILIKGDEQEQMRAATVVGLAVNVSALIAVLILPYMPLVSKQLQLQLDLPSDFLIVPDNFVPMLPEGHKIGTPAPLFQKIEISLGDELKKRFSGIKDATVLPTNTVKSESSGEKDVVGDQVKETLTVAELEEEITKQGNIVRKVKAEKANKDIIDGEVKKLLDLKKALASTQGKSSESSKEKVCKKTKKK
ncbi:methionine--tRNA ligase, cytoplasmic isoform X3 [Hydra vulgaris]|uniref:Methionine--tRNA ligase, cytoplasmic n=2 Tax=Hydra vulgaris TaxID=6087 RepID=A0ABM4CSY9_HYDVU